MSHHQEPTPTAGSTTTITLQTPADVVAVLPYLVGYHQDHTIHLVLVDGHHFQAVMRRELPEQSEDVAEFVIDTVRILTRNRASAVVMVGHGPGERVTPVMDALAPALNAQHIEVVDMIRYENGRCGSYLCSNPACCPPDGIPYDTDTSSAVAHLVAAPKRSRIAGPHRGQPCPASRARQLLRPAHLHCPAIRYHLIGVRGPDERGRPRHQHHPARDAASPLRSASAADSS